MTGACRDEGERLLALADQLVDAAPSAADELRSWYAGAHSLLEDSALETLAGEQRLDGLAEGLRRAWLRVAHGYAQAHWRSPPRGSDVALPAGASVRFTYERALRPAPLEARLAACRPAPPGWESDHVLFSSGMAALALCLQSYPHLAPPSQVGQLRVLHWGGYFETAIVLNLIRGTALEWRRAATQAELVDRTRRSSCDLLLVEPVSYDWDLEVLDLEALAEAFLRRAADRPTALVVDATLVGPQLPHQDLLEALREGPPRVVAVVASGSKLEQQGFELANAGLVSIFTRAGASPDAVTIGDYLRRVRGTVGVAPSLEALALLSAPFFLDGDETGRHANAVFVNNALLATSLEQSAGVFARVAHPALDGPPFPWSVAPFAVLHLAEDTLDNHRRLLAIVEHEARRRNLSLTVGSSFGFRGHRVETILPWPKTRGGLFKVAAGARAGPSLEGLLELLEEIGAYSDFGALRRAFAGIQPAPAPAGER